MITVVLYSINLLFFLSHVLPQCSLHHEEEEEQIQRSFEIQHQPPSTHHHPTITSPPL